MQLAERESTPGCPEIIELSGNHKLVLRKKRIYNSIEDIYEFHCGLNIVSFEIPKTAISSYYHICPWCHLFIKK
jgi:hypothetical protein